MPVGSFIGAKAGLAGNNSKQQPKESPWAAYMQQSQSQVTMLRAVIEELMEEHQMALQETIDR
jgi:hypothetical protein